MESWKLEYRCLGRKKWSRMGNSPNGQHDSKPTRSVLEWKKFWYDTKVVSEASYEIAKTYALLDKIWGTTSKLVLGLTAAGVGIQAAVHIGLVSFSGRLKRTLPWMAIASSIGYAVSEQCKFGELSLRHHKVGAAYGPIARAVQFGIHRPSDDLWEKLCVRRDEAEKESIAIPRWVFGYASHLVLFKSDKSLMVESNGEKCTISAPSKWEYFWIGSSGKAFNRLRLFKQVWEENACKSIH